MFESSAVAVATTATVIFTADRPGMNPQVFYVRNVGASTVEVGGAGVTFGTGYPIEPNEVVSFEATEFSVLYGIVASGTVNVRVLNSRP